MPYLTVSTHGTVIQSVPLIASIKLAAVALVDASSLTKISVSAGSADMELFNITVIVIPLPPRCLGTVILKPSSLPTPEAIINLSYTIDLVTSMLGFGNPFEFLK